MNWKDKKSCRTCIYAEATDKDRSYAQRSHRASRCLFPMNELVWPEMPFSVSYRHEISGFMEDIKHGLKVYVWLKDEEHGADCPQWKRWKQD